MIDTHSQSGFTVIELLITLFIAVAFLVSGYQLYSVIIKDGGETRAQTSAVNIANDYLQRYKSSAVNPCVAQTPLDGEPISVNGLSNVTIGIQITCPYQYTQNISKVVSTIKYGLDQTPYSIGSYVNSGDSAATHTITNGLVGWWKLDGSADESTNSSPNGTVIGASPVANRDGTSGRAMRFTGSNSYIDYGISADYDYTEFSVSVWAKADSATQAHVTNIIGKGNWNQNNNWYLGFKNGTDLSFMYGIAWSSGPQYPITSISLTQWHMYTGTASATQQKLYIDGVEVGSVNIGHIAVTNSYNMQIARSSYASNFFTGNVDDARIYNRALSASEVSSLYNGGAY